MKLCTIDGKEMSCITVIAACIEHITKKAKDRIKGVNKDLQETDIHWVLTVPAIWREQSRQFMIKAAEKVYITEFSCQHKRSNLKAEDIFGEETSFSKSIKLIVRNKIFT